MKISEKKENTKFNLNLDNCSSHKIENIFQYFHDNKINTLFTPSYKSSFTPIELVFRALKPNIYNKLYVNLEEITKGIKNLLEKKI